MPTTIYRSSMESSVDSMVVLMGRNRKHVIGDIAYRFKTLNFCQLPTKTFGYPVMWVNGKWQDTQLGRPIFVSIHSEITPLAFQIK